MKDKITFNSMLSLSLKGCIAPNLINFSAPLDYHYQQMAKIANSDALNNAITIEADGTRYRLLIVDSSMVKMFADGCYNRETDDNFYGHTIGLEILNWCKSTYREFTISLNDNPVWASSPTKFAQLFSDITPETRFKTSSHAAPLTFDELFNHNELLSLDNIERLTTTKLIDVDWDALHPDIMYVALDKQRNIWGFRTMSAGCRCCCIGRWISPNDGINLSSILSTPPIKVSPHLNPLHSLTKRPEEK